MECDRTEALDEIKSAAVTSYHLPVDEGLEDHLHEGDEGVEDPVGQPLLVVQLRRALHRLHRRIPAHEEQNRSYCRFEISQPNPSSHF
jgi:hypothetical protein